MSAPYCSQCGSEACFRPSDSCRAEERLELAGLIQTGWIGISSFETSVKIGAKPEEQDRLDADLQVMRDTWQNELNLRKLNVDSRANEKIGYYAKKRLRRMAAEDEPEFLLSPGRIREYDVATTSVLCQKLVVDGSMRIRVENSPEGLEFTTGKAATMLLQLSACHILAKAMVDWNRHVKENLLAVLVLLKSYMSEVTR